MNQPNNKKNDPPTGKPYDPMTSKTMKNAMKCCTVHKSSTTSSELAAQAAALACPGPSREEKLAGDCEVDMKFRADVVEVEQFIPNVPFHYPELPDTKCPLGEPFLDPCADKPLYINPETGEIMVDELASRHNINFSPCFDSWKQGGYQRER